VLSYQAVTGTLQGQVLDLNFIIEPDPRLYGK
jgi:hypothetical protein